MDLISKVGVIVLMGCSGGCWSYFGVSIQRSLSAWGWEGLKLAGGNPHRHG